jgi:hypothetical protein
VFVRNSPHSLWRWELELYNKYGPWGFDLSDFRFVPGTKIKDGVQLVTAIHGINPHQQMALMTADPKGARGNLPQALGHVRYSGSTSGWSKCCGSPCCRSD